MAGSLYQWPIRREDQRPIGPGEKVGINRDRRAKDAYDKLAYRMGRDLVNPVTGEQHKYPRKDVVASGIVLPSKYRQDARLNWARDASNLAFAIQYGQPGWGAPEGKGARIGRDYTALLPGKDEFDDKQRHVLAKSFAQRIADEYNVPVIYGVHLPEEGRAIHYHGHFTVPTRQLRADGWGIKARYELTREERRERGWGGSGKTEFRNMRTMFQDELDNAYEDFGIVRWTADRGESAAKIEFPGTTAADAAGYVKALNKQFGKWSHSMLKTIKVYGKIVEEAQSRSDDAKKIHIPVAKQKVLLRQVKDNNRALRDLRKVMGKANRAVGLTHSDPAVGDIRSEISLSSYEQDRLEKQAHAPEARLAMQKLSRLTHKQAALQKDRQEKIRDQEAAIGGRQPMIAASVRSWFAQLKQGKAVSASRVVAQTRSQLAAEAKYNDNDR